MPYRLSDRSKRNLIGVHPDMVAVVTRAIEISPADFMVIEGVRTPERQKELYAQGRTKPGKRVTWTLNSNHFKQSDGFGRAVDLLPEPYDWKDPGQFDKVARAMREAGKQLGVKIRWGGDWDQDGRAREKGETDSPHFELAR
jgi:peptidoglycan L-alanyl-D-glutamate endopeptidase CwlK